MEPTNRISEDFWVAHNQDEDTFLVIRTITTSPSGIITSYILERHPDLEKAEEALKIIQEEGGVPPNSCQSGNIIGLGGAKDGVVPFLFGGGGWSKNNKKSSLLRRWLKGID